MKMINKIVITLSVFSVIGIHIVTNNSIAQSNLFSEFSTTLIDGDPSNDLSILDSVLINKNYLFLGESSHGDLNTLEAKAEVIKYCIEKLGFTIILIEKGFYETSKMYEFLFKNYNKDEVLNAGFSQSYYLQEGTKPLRNLINSHYREGLLVGGVDISYDNWFGGLIYSDLRRIGLDKKLVKNYKKALEQVIDNDNEIGFDKAEVIDLSSFYKLTTKLIELINTNENGSLVVQTLKSNLGLAEWVVNRKPLDITSKNGTFEYFAGRDSLMAKNLMWYIKEYPDSKIIVSTSTFHMTPKIGESKTMMDYVPDSILRKSYLMPFIFFEKDEIKHDDRIIGIDSTLRSESSIEYLLHSNNYKNGILDFEKLNQEQVNYLDDLIMYPSIRLTSSAKWSNVYNGVYFIHSMRPDRFRLLSIKSIDYLKKTLYKYKPRY